jgi:hypothetical protein
MGFNATTRTIDNENIAQTSWPVAALAPEVQYDSKNATPVVVTGPASGAYTVLPKPAQPGSVPLFIMSYVTASGAATTPLFRRLGVEYSFNPADRNNGNGNATIKDIDATNHSTETWIVFFFPFEANGTIGGQKTSVTDGNATP